MKRNAAVFAILVTAILAMLAAGRYLDRTRKQKGSPSMVGDVRGRTAPDFELATLDGRKVKLSDYRGKAVVLNFWATWCAPCKTEMPWFVDLQKQYGKEGLTVLGIAMDDTEPPKIAEFAHGLGVNYPVLLGTDKVAEDYGSVQYLPTTFYIDRNGKIASKTAGLLGRSQIEEDVKKVLESKPETSTATRTDLARPGEPQRQFGTSQETQ